MMAKRSEKGMAISKKNKNNQKQQMSHQFGGRSLLRQAYKVTLIRNSIEQNVGKSTKDMRILGCGLLFSNKTSSRFNIQNKRKLPMIEEELRKEEEEKFERMFRERMVSYEKDLLVKRWQAPPTTTSIQANIRSSKGSVHRDTSHIVDNHGLPNFQVNNNVHISDNCGSSIVHIEKSSRAPKCSRPLLFKKTAHKNHKQKNRAKVSLPLALGAIQQLVKDKKKCLG